jgi:hypothetical protein
MSKAHCSVRLPSGAKLIASVKARSPHLRLRAVLTTQRSVLTTVMGDEPLSALSADRFDGCAGKRTRLPGDPLLAWHELDVAMSAHLGVHLG